MSQETKAQSAARPQILVAINFDQQAANLLEAANTLCDRFSRPLRLVNVVDPLFDSYVSMGQQMTHLNPELFRSIEGATIESTMMKLRELAASLGSRHPLHYSVVADAIVPGLLGEARALSTNLLVVGAEKGAHKLWRRGFSTAMSLLKEAAFPVLVIPEGQCLKAEQPLRIIVADDLRDENLPAMRAAYMFASEQRAYELLHLHVSSLSQETFSVAMNSALATARSPAEFSPAEVWTMVQGQLKKRLDDRAASEKAAFISQGGRHSCRLEFGSLDEKLEQIISSYQPNLLIFGQHGSFHRDTLGYGQVPFHSMLALGKPLLMIPNHFDWRK